jgi:MFS family permease
MLKSPAYLLGLLVAVACVHNIDRMAFSIVLDGVKRTLALSDTQLGFLAGTAFALLNAAAAIPVARLADRFGRKTLLAVCILMWSGFTSLCGLATGFAQLAVARACVGFADAGASPISVALVASAYPPARRPGMMAILLCGTYLGSVLGFAGAGIITTHFGWRTALLCMGVPGLVLGLVVWCTLHEPLEAQPAVPAASPANISWLTEWIPIVRTPLFLDATLAVASSNILGWALVAWLPSFLHRSYGMGSEQIGFWLAGVMGLATAAGALAGGAISNRLFRGAPRRSMWLSFWATLLSAPLLTLAFITDSLGQSLGLIIASGIAGSVCMGPVYAVVQGVADRRTRATVAAVFGVANSVLGQALGPLLVGAVSDISVRTYGTESVRFSLEIVSLLGFWPAIHLYRLARRPLPEAAG